MAKLVLLRVQHAPYLISNHDQGVLATVMLSYPQPFIRPGRTAVQYLTDLEASDTPGILRFSTPLDNCQTQFYSEWARSERKQRHRYGFYVPNHCRKVIQLLHTTLSWKYCPFPPDNSTYEVHYGFLVPNPLLTTYYSVDMMRNPHSPCWAIFRCERALLAVVGLVYSTSRGILYHLLPALIADIRELGCSKLTENAHEEGILRVTAAVDLAHLLYENEAVRLDKVTPTNRNLQKDAGLNTPANSHGEWAQFDTDRLETVMRPDKYRAEIDGVFVERTVESVRLYGTTDGLTQRLVPTQPSLVGPFADIVDGMPSGPAVPGSRSAGSASLSQH